MAVHPDHVLNQFCHSDSRVRHPVGEAPLVVIPGQHRHHRTVHDLGLIHMEDRGVRIVVEVDGDVLVFGVAENAFERAASCRFDSSIDFFNRGRRVWR
jgi:hypothetical protein